MTALAAEGLRLYSMTCLQCTKSQEPVKLTEWVFADGTGTPPVLTGYVMHVSSVRNSTQMHSFLD